MIDIRTFLKKMIRDARLEIMQRDQAETLIGTHGSQSPREFTGKKGSKKHLTEEYVNTLSEKEVEDQILLLAMYCFRQR